MKHLDLFSGIGGFALAAKWTGWETVAFCERDKYAAGILQQHWPDVPVHDDIRNIKQRIGCDIITGGFPCQPFSVAGKQTGTKDDRYLWPEMLRIIAQERPTWVVGENVTGIIGLALDQVLADLEGEGYTCQTFVIPAVAVDAPHRRDRVWIIGYADGHRQSNGPINAKTSRLSPMANSGSAGCEEQHSSTEPEGQGISPWSTDPGRADWPAEPRVGRVAHGIPNRVDRIKALGNAIVPQVAYQIFKAINATQRD